MKKYINIILSISLFIPIYGRENPNDNSSSSSIWSRFAGKTTAIDQYSLINIGNMEYWVKEMVLLVILLKVVLVGFIPEALQVQFI